MGTRFLQRRGTASEWATVNPILGPAEFGIEEDTDIIKIGDGVTAWLDLDPAFEDAFLPIDGKAADSDKLDGFDSSTYLKVADAPALMEAEALEARRMLAYSQPTSFTFDLTSENKLFSNGGASAVVYTVPADASVNFPIGAVIDSMLTGTGSITLTADAGVTFVVNGLSLAAGSSYIVPYRYATVRLYKRSANLWNVYILSNEDTGWVTTGLTFSPITNWTVNSYKLRRISGRVRGVIDVTYSGSTLTAGADANLADINGFITMPSGWRITNGYTNLLPLWRAGYTPLWGRAVNGNVGTIDLVAGNFNGQTLTAATPLSVLIDYLID